MIAWLESTSAERTSSFCSILLFVSFSAQISRLNSSTFSESWLPRRIRETWPSKQDFIFSSRALKRSSTESCRRFSEAYLLVSASCSNPASFLSKAYRLVLSSVQLTWSLSTCSSASFRESSSSLARSSWALLARDQSVSLSSQIVERVSHLLLRASTRILFFTNSSSSLYVRTTYETTACCSYLEKARNFSVLSSSS